MVPNRRLLRAMMGDFILTGKVGTLGLNFTQHYSGAAAIMQ